ncbi:MAG: hypothetical protein KAR45_21890 [Desulfobacteraceae bacterium]|nr:hypothetical protein [Desulfobacteraceae bacterium]
MKKYTLNLFKVLFCLTIFLSYASPIWADDILFSGVWGSSANDIFIVGRKNRSTYPQPEPGIILHYNGNVWQEMEVTNLDKLKGVWGTSSTNVYAVGGYGKIWHYNGTAWQIVLENGLADGLREIWGSSASDIFAVGHKIIDNNSCGVILHYDGSVWGRIHIEEDPSPYYSAVWGSSSTDVFVDGFYSVCDGNECVPCDDCILHFNDTAWTRMVFSSGSRATGIWGTSSSNVYATDLLGGVYKYNGSYCSTIKEQMDYYNDGGAIWGSSSTDIFVVGDFVDWPQTPPPGHINLIFHYDGSAFQEMNYPDSDSNYLRDVWGSSSSDVYAVGGLYYGSESPGFVVHYNGVTWNKIAVLPDPATSIPISVIQLLLLQ